MQAKDIIGKTITDIYQWVEYEIGGLDQGECFLEIDKDFFVKIPYFEDEEIAVENIDKRATSFSSNQAMETVNKPDKEKNKVLNKGEERRAFFRQLGKHLGRMASYEEIAPKSKPHKTENLSNEILEIKGQRIIDFIWDTEEDKKGLFLLSNGFLITEMSIAPNGLGLAGLNCFENMEKLVNSGQYDYSDLERITYDLP